ncbi:MAG: hypothetical protein ACOH13_13090 [Flavobacteriales bacterium]
MKHAKRIAQFTPDYAGMSAAARAEMLAELERHYFTPRYQCSPFDPSALVTLAQEQYPHRPEFAEALGRCTEQWRENTLCAYFQDPAQRLTRAKWIGSFWLVCPTQGELIIDVLEDGNILSIEYLEVVMLDHERNAKRLVVAPPVLKIVHWG